MTTVNAKNINCETINCSNIRNTIFSKAVKTTFDNTSSSDNFLKNAAFFEIEVPANILITFVAVYVTENDIVVGAADADTLLNVADGTNSIVGAATSITIGSAPNSAGMKIADENSEERKRTFTPSWS